MTKTNFQSVIIAVFSLLSATAFAAALKKTSVTGDGNDALISRLVLAISERTNLIDPPRLSPPSTNQGFWLQGGDLSKLNTAKGLLFTTWQQGNDPQGGTGSGYALAAFKGWVFLRPNGNAEIVFASYLYFLGRQNAIEATVVKDMSRCKIETRSFEGSWSILGHRLRVRPSGANPDPRHFDQSDGSVEYDLDDHFAQVDKLAKENSVEGKAARAATDRAMLSLARGNLNSKLLDELRKLLNLSDSQVNTIDRYWRGAMRYSSFDGKMDAVIRTFEILNDEQKSIVIRTFGRAQEDKGRGNTIERLEQAVGSLTADQKAKITAIVQKSQDDLQGVPMKERKEMGAAIMKTQRADIRAVLTPDQQTKFDEKIAQGGKKNK